MTCGSPSWLTARDACSTQASALAVPGSGGRDRSGGLKAYPYKAARNLRAPGVRPVSRVSSGVAVASASARLARECGARCGHFISAYATACRYQVTGSGPGAAHDSGSPVPGVMTRTSRPSPATRRTCWLHAAPPSPGTDLTRQLIPARSRTSDRSPAPPGSQPRPALVC